MMTIKDFGVLSCVIIPLVLETMYQVICLGDLWQDAIGRQEEAQHITLGQDDTKKNKKSPQDQELQFKKKRFFSEFSPDFKDLRLV